MAGFVVSKDNTNEVLDELEIAVQRALTKIGAKAEKYAKALCPVGTTKSTGKKGYRGGTLRNSITYDIEVFNVSDRLCVGSNVEYAPYVELGTGPYFEPPPEWEHFESKKGSGMPGVSYVKARPFLRPAIENHISEFKDIIKSVLED